MAQPQLSAKVRSVEPRSERLPKFWKLDREGVEVSLLTVGCALVLALSSLRLPFLWDDFDFLGRAGNLRLRNLLPESSIVFYRPISREIYFWIITHILGGSALAAHLLNAAILCAMVILLVTFMRKVVGTRGDRIAGLVFASSAAPPLAAAWISAGQDLLCALFVMIGIHFQLQRKPWRSALSMAAALLSKETAIALLPVPIILAAMRPGRERGDLVRSAVAHGCVVFAWAAVHPWTRSLLTGAALTAGADREYLGFRWTGLTNAIAQGIGMTLNFPWVASSPRWPGHLIVPALLVTIAIVWSLTRKKAYSESVTPGGRRLAIVVGSMVLAGPVVLTGLVIGRWSPYYALVPALGLSMLAGAVLTNAPASIRAASIVIFLWLGVGLRGNPVAQLIPTEPNLRESASALEKVEAGFKLLHPVFPPGSNVYVSVQARGSGGIYYHLFRFQPLRIWYQQPDLWVLDPNRRRRGGSKDYLFWIDPRLAVYEIRLTDLFPHGPTKEIGLRQYQKTLRGYAFGLAGSGDVNRAVYILANMPEDSKEVQVFDRRTAVALLLATGHKDEAMQLSAQVPSVSRAKAIESVVALLAEPVSGLTWDDAAMKAFGLDPSDTIATRILMRRFVTSGYTAAAGRFASRLQVLHPGDQESAAVIRLTTVEKPKQIMVPVPYDIPQ